MSEYKYICPICEKPITNPHYQYCCGRKVYTPEGAVASHNANMGCLKFLFIFVGLPLLLLALIGIGSIGVSQFREHRDATRVVDTGLNLPLTATNTTVVINANGGVTYYITPNGELREIAPQGVNVIDNNVRSVYTSMMTGVIGVNTPVTFYIKNDNSLWGFGSNERGRLGTGTGVDTEEPVLIMENVAVLTDSLFGWHAIYAIKTDRTLWTWGDGEFSPIQVAEDVVAIFTSSGGQTVFQKSDGLLYRNRVNRDGEREIERVRPSGILNFIGPHGITGQSGFYVNHENALIRWDSEWGGMFTGNRQTETEITQNVQSLSGSVRDSRNYNLFLIKTDDTLWGFGNNASGELGDGTRVPRDNPVRIAENVKSAGEYYFLTINGELWIWDSENPTPAKVLDNVNIVFPHDSSSTIVGVLLNDGTVTSFRQGQQFVRDDLDAVSELMIAAGLGPQTHSGIKIPQTIVFD